MNLSEYSILEAHIKSWPVMFDFDGGAYTFGVFYSYLYMFVCIVLILVDLRSIVPGVIGLLDSTIPMICIFFA